MQAQKVRRLITEDFNKVFENVDILLTPTVLSDAPLFSDFVQRDNRAQTQEQDVFTQPVNLAGVFLSNATLYILLISSALFVSC